MLKCKLCVANVENIDYKGETKRPMRLRFNEHVRDMICRRNDTPMGDYFRTIHHEAGHTPLPFEVRVLYRARDHPDRKIM